MKIVIMIAVFYIPAVRIFEMIRFFRSDYFRAFVSFVAEERFFA